MSDIYYIDRQTEEIKKEKVYGEAWIRFFYSDHSSSFLARPLVYWMAKSPFLSKFYGWLQKLPFSKQKIIPFIKTYEVDSSEFADDISSYPTFNDFFTRKLNPKSRPIHPNDAIAIIPADGRYYFYQNLDRDTDFIVKGQRLNLEKLLNDRTLAEKFNNSSCVIARLCPSDYHRFHFPCDCTPSDTTLINGSLFSVNPLAIQKDVSIFWQNKRTLCRLQTVQFGEILYLEIGATNVGSIKETYQPNKFYKKGDEKGYFEFGGSSLILLFEKNTIQFDEDLIQATQRGYEIRCLFGQSLGQKKETIH